MTEVMAEFFKRAGGGYLVDFQGTFALGHLTVLFRSFHYVSQNVFRTYSYLLIFLEPSLPFPPRSHVMRCVARPLLHCQRSPCYTLLNVLNASEAYYSHGINQESKAMIFYWIHIRYIWGLRDFFIVKLLIWNVPGAIKVWFWLYGMISMYCCVHWPCFKSWVWDTKPRPEGEQYN